MDVFKNYAQYYDLIYREKDYAHESSFVHDQLVRHGVKLGRLLELGCGTGRHAVEFAKLGWDVHGIDRSPQMISLASDRARSETTPNATRLNFCEGNVSDFKLGFKADAVISLFHVVSYLTLDVELESMFKSVFEHLVPGGVFLFDVWYGPTVLSIKPEVRVKEYLAELLRITRVSSFEMKPTKNQVLVKYQIFARQRDNTGLDEINEAHPMRYFFTPEIEGFASRAGLRIIDSFEWMTCRDPGFDTWGVCFVARR